jgi:branched-subunit amino acid aminotransferase/4-amino-4-deoxychorismate lyase
MPRAERLRSDAMSREELKALERRLSLLSPHGVQENYKRLADKCRFLDLPTPRIMQELVATWKVLWKWRR